MSKSSRGKGILKLVGRGRGTCPLCNATKAKLLWNITRGDKQFKVCKKCRNH